MEKENLKIIRLNFKENFEKKKLKKKLKFLDTKITSLILKMVFNWS